MKKQILTAAVLATITTVSAVGSDYKPYTRNSNASQQNISSFERGFSTAVHAMERELRMMLSEQLFARIDNKYIVYIDVRNMPNEHILIAKNYIIKEGFYPTTTKNKLIIDGVDRVADAKHIIQLLKAKYFPNRKIHYKRNTTKIHGIHDHMFGDIIKSLKEQKCATYEMMLEDKSSSRF